jgi:hypothetical protein
MEEVTMKVVITGLRVFLSLQLLLLPLASVAGCLGG